jgi:hypothetical protein
MNQSGQQPSTVDFETDYKKLYNAVYKANSDKKRRVEGISDDIKKCLKIVCEPDPPGCSGPDPSVTVEELARQCREWNSKKRDLLLKAEADIDGLLKVVCEPNPPGCDS